MHMEPAIDSSAVVELVQQWWSLPGNNPAEPLSLTARDLAGTPAHPLQRSGGRTCGGVLKDDHLVLLAAHNLEPGQVGVWEGLGLFKVLPSMMSSKKSSRWMAFSMASTLGFGALDTATRRMLLALSQPMNSGRPGTGCSFPSAAATAACKWPVTFHGEEPCRGLGDHAQSLPAPCGQD